MCSFGFDVGGMVLILGFNTLEWVMFDVVCMMVGGVFVGIYVICLLDEV